MDAQNFFTQIEDHLKSPKHFISVEQGSLKLQKQHTTTKKTYFFLKDVLDLNSSVEAFVKSLPEYGFSTGAVLKFRVVRGNSSETLNETKLTYPESNQQPPAPVVQTIVEPTEPPQNSLEVMHTPSTNPTTTPTSHVQPNYFGLGAAMDPTEILNLKIKEGRFEDLKEKYDTLKKLNNSNEDALRKEKDKSYDLARKLELIEDRHELKMEKALSDNKKWYETEVGAEAIGLGTTLIPELISVIKKPTLPTAIAAMGASTGQAQSQVKLSPEKEAFISEIAQMPGDLLQLLGSTAHHLTTTEGFKDTLSQLITSINQ